jgi:S1-C subfamily serine protease
VRKKAILMIAKTLSLLIIRYVSAVFLSYIAMNTVSPKFIKADNHLKPPAQRKTKQPLTRQELEKLAQSRMVRIFSSDHQTGGSGSLILRQGERHYILTNLHVVSQSGQYQIQTPDEKVHVAQVVGSFSSVAEGDLALLRFKSSQSYPVLPVELRLKGLVDQQTFACGFPMTNQLVQSEDLYCNTGKVSAILKHPLAGGYQVGYTNLIKQGMSGGPVINQYGELVGVNGLSQFPLFSNAYAFQDGRIASEEEISILKELSWAIPTRSAIELLNEFRSQNSL